MMHFLGLLECPGPHLQTATCNVFGCNFQGGKEGLEICVGRTEPDQIVTRNVQLQFCMGALPQPAHKVDLGTDCIQRRHCSLRLHVATHCMQTIKI